MSKLTNYNGRYCESEFENSIWRSSYVKIHKI